MNFDVKFDNCPLHFSAKFSEDDSSFDGFGQDLQLIHGKDGKSAYEVAVANGFEGTEAEWLESLHGKDGQDGKDGAPGRDGQDGRDGTDGKDGYTPVKGVDYFDGKDGEDGKDGHTPVKGKDYYTEADKAELVEEVLEQIPEQPSGSISVDKAEIGQTIVVKAVDENGKPTEWEAADLPVVPDMDTIAQNVIAKLPIYNGEVESV